MNMINDGGPRRAVTVLAEHRQKGAPAAPAAQAEPVAVAITEKQVMTAYFYASRLHISGTSNWVAAFAQSLNKQIAAPPAHPDAALVEAADAALKAIQDTLEDAYHNAFPECCGQAHLECCGSPIQAWDERDQKIMDRLGPHEKALRAALAGKGATK